MGLPSCRSRRASRTLSPKPGVSQSVSRSPSAVCTSGNGVASAVTCGASRTSPTSRPSSVRASVVLPAFVCEMSESETAPASGPDALEWARCGRDGADGRLGHGTPPAAAARRHRGGCRGRAAASAAARSGAARSTNTGDGAVRGRRARATRRGGRATPIVVVAPAREERRLVDQRDVSRMPRARAALAERVEERAVRLVLGRRREAEQRQDGRRRVAGARLPAASVGRTQRRASSSPQPTGASTVAAAPP